MAASEYPVKWKGKTYYLTSLTIDVKTAFCEWLVSRLRADAMTDFQGYPAKLNNYLDGLRARVWWVSSRMSPAVWEWLYESDEGGTQYCRCLMRTKDGKGKLQPLTVEAMGNEELAEFIDTKEADPASDYMVALAQIHEDANPKASGPANGSEPTETQPTEP